MQRANFSRSSCSFRLLPRAWGAAVRQQFLAGPLSCLDLRRVGIDARRLDGEHTTPPGRLSGSGKSGNPCERMQAEYATGSSELEPVDVSVPVVVEETCATPAPDEPPQAEASRATPPMTTSARVRRLLVPPG
jgi:hypothetical protein